MTASRLVALHCLSKTASKSKAAWPVWVVTAAVVSFARTMVALVRRDLEILAAGEKRLVLKSMISWS